MTPEDGSAPKTSNITVRRGDPLVVVSNVQKHYGDFQALKDIDLTVNRGEVVVVIGPSGSGKSTLCRTINRLETITSGTISIDGKELPKEGKGLAELRADVGMVFQSFNLFAHLTILDNVTLGPIKVRKMKKADAERQAKTLLDRVGVGQQADKLPGAALGRPAAARRDRPGARDEPEGHALRRADQRPRPRDDQRGARRHGRASPTRA